MSDPANKNNFPVNSLSVNSLPVYVQSNLSLTKWQFTDPIGKDNPPPLTPEGLGNNDLADELTCVDAQNKSQPLLREAEINQPTANQSILSENDFTVDWQSRFDEQTLSQFVNDGFVMLDEVYSRTALLAMQAESGFIDYRDARLADGIRKTDIRGDRIRWITKDFFAGFYYLQSINTLAQWFNRTLFAGIRHSEAHYACYPVGFGYQWHTDNPIGRDERVISAVFYLNDEWTQEDGGALSLIDTHGHTHQLLPKANRLVIFDSNLRHQVEIAHRERYSIATWLRRDCDITALSLGHS